MKGWSLTKKCQHENPIITHSELVCITEVISWWTLFLLTLQNIYTKKQASGSVRSCPTVPDLTLTFPGGRSDWGWAHTLKPILGPCPKSSPAASSLLLPLTWFYLCCPVEGKGPTTWSWPEPPRHGVLCPCLPQRQSPCSSSRSCRNVAYLSQRWVMSAKW